MPPLASRKTRELLREGKKIPSNRALHRGINIQKGVSSVNSFRSNQKHSPSPATELLVHHQKIKLELQNIYKRTAALNRDNMSMNERIEESWRKAEMIGLKRSRANEGFAKHLKEISTNKKDQRSQMAVERATGGDLVDFRQRSALHLAKEKRIENFQRRQLKRAHLLRRMGDPTPLKQSGRYDINNGTLEVFNKTIRKVKREAVQEKKISDFKPRKAVMWNLHDRTDNINRPEKYILKSDNDVDLGYLAPVRKRRRIH